MAREPIILQFLVSPDDVDEAFDWWMRQYERDPDGQFFDAARQLKPHVTTERYESWRPQFEHPKGETVMRVIGPDPGPGHCQKHLRPIAPGYCE